MKLIVISHPTSFPDEYDVIKSLFENDLEIFDVHKPAYSKEQIEDFLKKIPKKYSDRVILHSHIPSFHSLEEIDEYKADYHYAYLSPVFDSISKKGYTSAFDLKTLGSSLRRLKRNLIALGGIDEDKIEIVREIGFAGVAVLGAVWNSKNPIEKFQRIKEKCAKKDLVF